MKLRVWRVKSLLVLQRDLSVSTEQDASESTGDSWTQGNGDLDNICSKVDAW